MSMEHTDHKQASETNCTYWAFIDTWSIEEAASLLNGNNPEDPLCFV